MGVFWVLTPFPWDLMLMATAKFDRFNWKKASPGGTARNPAERKAQRN